MKPTKDQVLNKLWSYLEMGFKCDGKYTESKESILRAELGENFEEAYSEVMFELMEQL